MELGSCIARVICQDDTLTNIIIRPSCIIACSNYEHNESDDDNDSLDGLTMERSGSREWFCALGVMFGRLPNLTQLTFDDLDPDNENLEQFWGEISRSTSLTGLYFINMNLVSCEEMMITADAPNITSITFQQCTIPNDIGYLLRHYNLATLVFNECNFNDT